MSDRIAVMRNGRIEQLGPPEELYERPRTTFVAGFLGVSNLLDGTVVSRSDGLADIRLDDGSTLRAPAGDIVGAGAVRIGVRPEKLRVASTGAGAAEADPRLNSIDGTVIDASYIGVSTQYLVRTAEGHVLTVYAQNLETSGASEILSDGQSVRVAWKPEHTFVIDGGDRHAEPSAHLEEERTT